MLSLNGFLLRSNTTPAKAWTDSASEDVEIFSWEKGQLAALGPDDAEILDAAEAGDIIVAMIRRFSAAPRRLIRRDQLLFDIINDFTIVVNSHRKTLPNCRGSRRRVIPQQRPDRVVSAPRVVRCLHVCHE